MFDRSPLRVLAPIALCVFFILAIVVIANSGDDASTTGGKTATTKGSKKLEHYYRVKAGETLTMIAEKKGLDIGTLEALNPDVDPQSLQEGQLIRLRPRR